MPQHDLTRLTLRAGPALVEICPGRGGIVTRYCWTLEERTLEWFRPTPQAHEFGVLDAGCFPLVPFSGRVRGGRFPYEGKVFSMPMNFPPQKHTIHGHGWQRPWQIAEANETAASIVYHHAGDDWTTSYDAIQRFEITESDLSISLSATNTGNARMPLGLGLHPYFVRTPRAHVRAKVGQMWLSDEEVMPVDLVAPPPDKNLVNGIVADAVALDNTFTDFSGTATVDWPEWRASLTITADSLLQFLVVYTPPGESFLCVEPVSNCADAFNLAAEGRTDTGMRILAPGETLSANVRFTPHINLEQR